jgi:3-hydroxy-9,10-secoandrosta-1,3,5(10)-triene-9,17-dione monooxygenase reductase component
MTNPIDPLAMRSVLGHFCTGVAVVTGIDVEPVGLTMQSLTSVSLDPPLILICPQKSSTSWPRIARTGSFCVNVLSAGQHELGLRFARSGGDKFTGVPWHASTAGAPRLDAALAHIDCAVHAVHEAGDHLVVLGRVTELAADGELGPLLFYRGEFGSLAA